jgi:hypothetical protein
LRLSQFHELVQDEFGDAYGRVLLHDLALGDLGDLTANAALVKGVDPKIIWMALCREAQVPADRWHGRNKPKKAN